eukprot:3599038-Amphidinium_carterae.1
MQEAGVQDEQPAAAERDGQQEEQGYQERVPDDVHVQNQQEQQEDDRELDVQEPATSPETVPSSSDSRSTTVIREDYMNIAFQEWQDARGLTTQDLLHHTSR